MRLKGFGFQRRATLFGNPALSAPPSSPCTAQSRPWRHKNIVFHKRAADLLLSISLPSPAGGLIWRLTGG